MRDRALGRLVGMLKLAQSAVHGARRRCVL